MAGISAQASELVKLRASYFIWLLLLAVIFTLATLLQPRAAEWNARSGGSGMMDMLLGDSRKMFANHFFVQADVSFHSGYYPSVFDQTKAPAGARHMTAHEGEAVAEEHEKQMDFLKPPKDWIERFGRHFLITEHTHLEGGDEREILPWLRISAELDPQKIENYTVAAYWLRDLGKQKEAEDFLRQGLRANPESYEILFDLGRLYKENYHDVSRARNVWDEALRKWMQQESGKKDPDLYQLDQIAVSLADLEKNAGNFSRAMELLEIASKASPHPEALRLQIEELKQKSFPNADRSPVSQ